MILFVIFNSFDKFYLFIFINLNDFHQLKFIIEKLFKLHYPLAKFGCKFYFSFILLSTDHMNLKYKVATIQYILMRQI
jgi:hypothetical protein